MIHISALSRVYLRVLVAARRGGLPVDLTTDLVQFAFSERPVDSDWRDGSWETLTTPAGVRSYARILVGPGGAATLTAGMRPVMLRISDNPERPVHRAGYVIIY